MNKNQEAHNSNVFEDDLSYQKAVFFQFIKCFLSEMVSFPGIFKYWLIECCLPRKV